MGYEVKKVSFFDCSNGDTIQTHLPDTFIEINGEQYFIDGIEAFEPHDESSEYFSNVVLMLSNTKLYKKNRDLYSQYAEEDRYKKAIERRDMTLNKTDK